uniref:Uncharacterized protein n=1 Tax=viral metagenome TaxID=1070528 RepID=A0A6C0DK90_9ZZZZ
MEREHLIIIALILVALYMMNTDHKDTVKAMAPMGRIRYEGDLLNGPPGPGPTNYIRTREGFYGTDVNGNIVPEHIRLSDKSFAHSQHIRNHIRNRNMNSMFNGVMGMPEDIRGLYV